MLNKSICEKCRGKWFDENYQERNKENLWIAFHERWDYENLFCHKANVMSIKITDSPPLECSYLLEQSMMKEIERKC